MPDINKLNKLLAQQEVLVQKITSEAREFEDDKIFNEYNRLKTENKVLSDNYNYEKNKILSSENDGLCEALASQLFTERFRFLSNSKAKLNAYFDSSAKDGLNALTRCEKEVKARFDACRKAISYEFAGQKNEWHEKINLLEKEIENESRRLLEEYRINAAKHKKQHKENISLIENQEIDEEKANKVLKQSKAERFIGANLLGKIGAVLIIIAVIFLSYLAYESFNNIIKCLFLFAFSTAVLIIALFINKKKRSPLSITIMSLAIGLFYASLAISHFSLKVFGNSGGMYIALIILTAITALGYVISSKLKSQSVAMFAQIGGYLPMIMIMATSLGELSLVYASMLFFLILSVLGFMLSSKFKWQILNYTAFSLSFVGTIYVASSVGSISGDAFSTIKAFALIYVFLTFAIYTALPMLTALRVKARFNVPDRLLMLINTLVSMLTLFIMFYAYGIGNYAALLALIFAAVYFGLFYLTKRFFVLEYNLKTLFWLVGMAFILMFPPMLNVQNRMNWFLFGWALQGAALLIYAILHNRLLALWTGFGVFLLAICNFIVVDVALNANTVGSTNIFVYKYSVITLIGIVLVAICMYKRLINVGMIANKKFYRDQNVTVPHLFSSAVYLNTLFYVIYLIYKIYDGLNIKTVFKSNSYYSLLLFMMLASFVFAVIVPKLFKTKIIEGFGKGVGFAAIFMLFIFNFFRLNAFTPIAGTVKEGSSDSRVLATFMIILLSAVSVYVVFDLFLRLYKRINAGVIVFTAFYFILIFTQILLIQYRLKYYNITFSIVYILTAMLLIGVGLFLKSPVTRRFALAFVVLSIIKLAVLDTWQLELYLRIIIYAVFGITLIAMSFLYQFFYKKFGDVNILKNESLKLKDK